MVRHSRGSNGQKSDRTGSSSICYAGRDAYMFRRSEMSLAELVPALQDLPREDKLEVIRLLVSDLTRQDGFELLQSGASYPIWTPLEAYDAARSLQQMLDQDRVQR